MKKNVCALFLSLSFSTSALATDLCMTNVFTNGASASPIEAIKTASARLTQQVGKKDVSKAVETMIVGQKAGTFTFLHSDGFGGGTTKTAKLELVRDKEAPWFLRLDLTGVPKGKDTWAPIRNIDLTTAKIKDLETESVLMDKEELQNAVNLLAKDGATQILRVQTEKRDSWSGEALDGWTTAEVLIGFDAKQSITGIYTLLPTGLGSFDQGTVYYRAAGGPAPKSKAY